MRKFPNSFLIAAFSITTIFLWSCASTKNENAAIVSETPAAIEVSSVEPIKITVSTNFEPKSIEVKKGQPVKLAFYRENSENCGGEIVFPKLNIRKDLPAGATVLVEFTPDESGEIGFMCGMDMMRGKILVQ